MKTKSTGGDDGDGGGTVTETGPMPDTPWEPRSPAASVGLPECDPGRYELLGDVGAGGLDLVRKVRDHRLDRTVALKELQKHSQEAMRIASAGADDLAILAPDDSAAQSSVPLNCHVDRVSSRDGSRIFGGIRDGRVVPIHADTGELRVLHTSMESSTQVEHSNSGDERNA